MSRPRAEDVKEALAVWLPEYVERLQRFDDLLLEPLETIEAAARLWLASQEQTPDYEAAEAEFVWQLANGHNPPAMKAVVDAALVGFHPQDEGDER